MVGKHMLAAGLVMLAPILLLTWIEQSLLLETIIRDSNPFKFLLLLVGCLGVGVVGSGLGYYFANLVKRCIEGCKGRKLLLNKLALLLKD